MDGIGASLLNDIAFESATSAAPAAAASAAAFGFPGGLELSTGEALPLMPANGGGAAGTRAAGHRTAGPCLGGLLICYVRDEGARDER